MIVWSLKSTRKTIGWSLKTARKMIVWSLKTTRKMIAWSLQGARKMIAWSPQSARKMIVWSLKTTRKTIEFSDTLLESELELQKNCCGHTRLFETPWSLPLACLQHPGLCTSSQTVAALLFRDLRMQHSSLVRSATLACWYKKCHWWFLNQHSAADASHAS